MAESTSRKAGRPRALSRERVVDAVLAIGFADLRVSRVAAWLGVNPATVYRFARGRSELVDLTISHLVCGTDWPRFEGRWRSYLSAVTWQLWRMLADHPGLTTAAKSLPMTNSDVLRLCNEVIDNLILAGFDITTAAIATDLALDLAVDDRLGRERRTEADVRMPDAEWESHFSAGSVAVMRAAKNGEPADWFGHKLEIVLDGIGCRLSNPDR